MAAYIAREITKAEAEQTALNARLKEQLDTYSILGAAATKAGEKAAAAAEKQAKAVEEQTEAQAEAQAAFGRSQHVVYGPKQIALEIDGMTKAIDIDVQSLSRWQLGMNHALAVLPMVKQNTDGWVHAVSQVNYVLTAEKHVKGVSEEFTACRPRIGPCQHSKAGGSIMKAPLSSDQASLAAILEGYRRKKLEASLRRFSMGLKARCTFPRTFSHLTRHSRLAVYVRLRRRDSMPTRPQWAAADRSSGGGGGGVG